MKILPIFLIVPLLTFASGKAVLYGYPDADENAEFRLKVLTRCLMGCAVSIGTLRYIAHGTEGFTEEDIKDLVEVAKQTIHTTHKTMEKHVNTIFCQESWRRYDLIHKESE